MTRQGVYVKHSKPKADGGEEPVDKGHYGAVMTARAQLIGQAGHHLAAGATIATRWSAVREQGCVEKHMRC